ncbi:UNVERIFIED_CONTAM: hypothetical protein GTU68_021029, partial [Idotea baltica]|nr:hypothetical protein [Idotea baltica]
MRLNRFIALSGVCARREADKLIAAGKIKINGNVVSELGTKVIPVDDKVTYKGEALRIRKFVYLLLNKPKNTITTTSDPSGRRTVMDFIKNATDQRVYPVGRLDRNTTGLLLLTNDGELAEKITHPSYKIRKIYHVQLERPMEEEDMQKLLEGV